VYKPIHIDVVAMRTDESNYNKDMLRNSRLQNNITHNRREKCNEYSKCISITEQRHQIADVQLILSQRSREDKS